MMRVPTTVFKMVRLRHLRISSCRLFPRENAKELHEESSKLHNLRTLSTPCFSCIEDAELMLTKTPNLLELKCHFTVICIHQSRLLVFTKQLEMLYISGEKLIHIPVCISASNLKRLTLHDVGLDLEDLSHIGHELPNLQALEVEHVLFQQLNWEVSDEEFPQLKVLKLVLKNGLSRRMHFLTSNAWFCVNAVHLRRSLLVSQTSLTLKYIQMEHSVEKSARDIRDIKVEDYQNADFELSIISLFSALSLLASAFSNVVFGRKSL